MRLQKEDLLNYCKVLNRETNGKYEIISIKGDYGYWSLYIKNTETKEIEIKPLCSGLTLREMYEYLRAFYNGIRFQKSILNSN